MWLSRWIFDGSLGQAVLIAVVLLTILIFFSYRVRSELSASPELLLNTALLITLLVSPYLYNYDFILLLVPFAFLMGQKLRFVQRLIVLICYLVPTFAIALYGRNGNTSLLVVTLVITILVFLTSKPKVDVPDLAA